MYLGNCVARRTRSKRKEYEDVFESRARPRQQKKPDIIFYSESEDEDEDLEGKGPTTYAESLESVAVPSAKRNVVEVKRSFKDMTEGKNLQKGVEKTCNSVRNTSKSKVGKKVDKTCHEDEITSKQAKRNFVRTYNISSSDDDDDDEDSQADSIEDSSSSLYLSSDREDEDYKIPGHEDSQRSESDASSEEDSLLILSNQTSCSPVRETGGKSAEKHCSIVTESDYSTSSSEGYRRREGKGIFGKKIEKLTSSKRPSGEAGKKSMKGNVGKKMEKLTSSERPLREAGRDSQGKKMEILTNSKRPLGKAGRESMEGNVGKKMKKLTSSERPLGEVVRKSLEGNVGKKMEKLTSSKRPSGEAGKKSMEGNVGNKMETVTSWKMPLGEAGGKSPEGNLGKKVEKPTSFKRSLGEARKTSTEGNPEKKVEKSTSFKMSLGEAERNSHEGNVGKKMEKLTCSCKRPLGEALSGSSTSSHDEVNVRKESEESSHDEVNAAEEDKIVGKEDEETNQLPKFPRQHVRTKDETFNILANSILHQDDTLEKMALEQEEKNKLARAARLPLKFSFEDEKPKPPEKSDFDKEVDEIFDEMFFGIEYGNMDYTSQSKTDEEAESSQTFENLCNHLYILNEEIGLVCKHCGHVETEIRDIQPEFGRRPTRRLVRKGSSNKEKGSISDALGFESSSSSKCNGESSAETDGTVWDNIFGVRHTLYQHQREGFEFLWRNIGGSVDLSKLSDDSSEVGGCIISHAPGTGKTRLAIVFIESYLKMFPHSRPVIIAPATMLNTWEEEFEKWNVKFPFHNLNRDEHSGKEDKIVLQFLDRRNKQTMNAVRMSKLCSWDREASVLGISYSLYDKLAGQKTQKGCKKRKRMAANEEVKENNNPWRDILLEKPGLVILDEGHTPRNDHSNIWNTLVAIHTKKVIILSGTPFQNNFDELMNSLSLIRPEVEAGFRNDGTFSELNPNLRYSRINPLKDEARSKAIHKLKATIQPFVHVHKGSILQQTLPGLREYVIILHPHKLQKALLKKMDTTQNTFILEHKVALVSVHPHLLQTYSSKQPGMCQDKTEYSSLNPEEGVKTRFVLELVRLSLSLNEKVLIFSLFKEPLNLIMDQIKTKFGWQEGREILFVNGDTLQNKRQNIIHSFNDPVSEAKVLMASTRCCSEGISLVGASRVVLLDVVWNPSVAMQALSRAYRIGQNKVVYAYHLMISGTTEADKYRRQAEKERLSELVFTCTDKEEDEQQRMPKIVASDDKILETMVDHPSMKDMFERVIYQPKESSFFKGFDSPF